MKQFPCGRCLAAASLLSAVLQTAHATLEKDNLQPPSHEAMPAERCGVITKDKAGRSALLPLPSLHVATASDSTPFSLPRDAPPVVSAIDCSRRSIIPQPYDYQVIKAGYPIYITVPAEGKVVVLEVRGGQVQIRAVRGELTADEVAQVQQAVDQIQLLLDKSATTKLQPTGSHDLLKHRPA